MQMYLCVVCATIHACSNTCVAWLFPSRVNLHVTSRVNIDFHGKFWHSAREKLRGATRGMYRVCEVVVELYRISPIMSYFEGLEFSKTSLKFNHFPMINSDSFTV